jgi:hypothetical protein
MDPFSQSIDDICFFDVAEKPHVRLFDLDNLAIPPQLPAGPVEYPWISIKGHVGEGALQ